jgi:hypothetical protein
MVLARSTFLVLSGLCLLLLMRSSAISQVVQDQRNDGPSKLFLESTDSNGVSADVAQTFLVGQTGLFTELDLKLANEGFGGQLSIDIRPTTVDGTPVSDPSLALGHVLINADTLPFLGSGTYTSIDFSSQNIQVASGQLLAFVIHPIDDRFYIAYFTAGSAYSAGDAYLRFGDESFSLFTFPQSTDFLDANFRTDVLIPEPAAVGLLGLMVSAVSCQRRRFSH